MFKLKNHLVTLWVFLIFIAAFSGAYLLLTPKTNSPPADKTPAPFVEANQTNPSLFMGGAGGGVVNSTATENTSSKKEASTSSAPSTVTDETFPAKFIVQNQEYSLSVKPGATVYDAMSSLALSSQKPFLFESKLYSGMGYFIEEINGIKNDTAKSIYWIYYINGEPAKIGVSNYIIKPNDIITWKYETNKF
mgnify:CR=1 FL=1